MIRVNCEQCGHAHEFFDGLAGMSVQCKGCRASIQIPRADGAITAQTPPIKPTTTAISVEPPAIQTQPAPSPGIDDDRESPLTPPPGIELWLLESWLSKWQAMGTAPDEMESKLVEQGCSKRFATWYVRQFLDAHAPGSARWRAARTQTGSAEIAGLDGLTDEMILAELQKGARFVVYRYCVSLILFSTVQPSTIQFIRSDESRFARGLRYSLISLIAGPWGFPWGPILTALCLLANTAGGTDVTDDIITGVDIKPDYARPW